MDLKSAYLQIRVTEDLWKHQLVRYKGNLYCLTRLGFGLNVAPKIMSKILKFVLRKDQKIDAGTSSYVDDIYVNKDTVQGEDVVQHLKENGLIAKSPEPVDGGAALGLSLKCDVNGDLRFRRANHIPEIPEHLTKKELFSVCGKLTGHYPVAGWLRLACSYVKRHAGGNNWHDDVGEETKERIKDVVREVERNDPVEGQWRVPNSETGVIWTDASDMALGVILEIEGVVVEDGSWMRKSDDYSHINVAELEAVLKGMNTCVNWGITNIVVKTDSATVEGWLKLTMSGERRVKTKGAAEILIKRRLGIFKNLVDELNLNVEVNLVKSADNKADALTRVWKKWMVSKEDTASMSVEELKNVHEKHHMGVERTWFLAKAVDPLVSKDMVKKVVRQCEQCQSIDPAPKQHTAGQLDVEENWTRVAIDVVHYRNIPYLSLVDCGPGRFAIWRKLKGESAAEVCRELDNICYERGPLKEVLLDNAPNFKSSEIKMVMNKWGIEPLYRAAWRPSGNGIVERHHRTIKAMAERMKGSPIDAVRWYNMAPKDGQKEESVPQRSVYAYNWRMTDTIDEEDRSKQCEFEIGDKVWVKPGNAKCTTKWHTGTVTQVNSNNNVDVDGMARHILDIRQRVINENETTEMEESEVEGGGPRIEVQRYPRRERAPPAWTRDYSQA